MPDAIIMVIITSILTGGFSAISTVMALKVHIDYIRESLTRHEHAIDRAHKRLNSIERMIGNGLGK
tara:strand:+ start:10617 stop:10814 length:198 start_codon:yes stop_codon:yes gene_type:complete